MKKLSTYYFIGLALLNAFSAISLADLHKHTYKFWREGTLSPRFYAEIQGDHDLRYLPPLTQLVIEYSWWPFIIAAVSLGGAVVSVATSIRSSSLCHFVIALLLLDTLIFSTMVVAYLLPFYDGTVVLSP
jgi:hypothetical protein